MQNTDIAKQFKYGASKDNGDSTFDVNKIVDIIPDDETCTSPQVAEECQASLTPHKG